MSAHAAATRTFWDVHEASVDPAWREKRRLAAALRALTSICVTTDAPEAALAYAADAAERMAERLAQHPRTTFAQGYARCATADDFARFADRSALTGHSNPYAPPIAVTMDGDRAIGRLTFDAPFEGVPGCVHGGLVAAAFDQVFGYLQVKRGAGSLTGSLTVRYLAPTPLLAPLQVEARVDRIEGKKSFVSARMHAGERLTAEAEAVFIRFDPSRLPAVLDGARAATRDEAWRASTPANRPPAGSNAKG